MFDVSIEVSWKMKCMRRRKENNFASAIMSFSLSVLLSNSSRPEPVGEKLLK